MIDSGLVNLAEPSVTTNPCLRILHMQLGSVDMGTSLGSSSVESTFHSDCGRRQSHFHFVESSF
ncbi:hypothetical protein CK203_044511 [Vitis vinifera]|uniref:Uncharacterized protein n=1 Tax=Vitis vinifera TaxID=29760 RepID=A0A438D5Z1_VITVI|nr:hypothetical protein CK203_116067 [Vitis vinifera]RVW81649.1 hypothetical protein CK203_044511 [Vitis vinifera]